MDLTTNILIKWILLIVIFYMTHINQTDIKYFHHTYNQTALIMRTLKVHMYSTENKNVNHPL